MHYAMEGSFMPNIPKGFAPGVREAATLQQFGDRQYCLSVSTPLQAAQWKIRWSTVFFHAKPAFSYRKFSAPGPLVSKFSIPLESTWAPIYVTKAFSSFHRGCWLQMMHVFLTRKMDRRKYFDFCDSAIFHVVFHSATINDASGVLLLNPTLIMKSYYLCPFTRKISVCEMTGNVMKREGVEFKWWLQFWSGIPSMWQ